MTLEHGTLKVQMPDGAYQFDIATLSPRLATASYEALHLFQLSPSGYGIHWPLIDEDISIPALITSTYGSI